MDLADSRKIRIDNKHCTYLHPKLQMAEALKNEMQKGGGDNNTVDIDARFRKQIIQVMDSTLNGKNNNTAKEVDKLLAITKEIGTTSVLISGLLIAGQAFFSIQNEKKSHFYIDKAIFKSKEAMDNEDATGYPVWKSCVLLKGALLYKEKSYDEALRLYEELANEASKRADCFYLMEARRLSGHIFRDLCTVSWQKNSLNRLYISYIFSIL